MGTLSSVGVYYGLWWALLPSWLVVYAVAQWSEALLHSGLLQQVLPDPWSLDEDTCCQGDKHTHTLLSIMPSTAPPPHQAVSSREHHSRRANQAVSSREHHSRRANQQVLFLSANRRPFCLAVTGCHVVMMAEHDTVRHVDSHLHNYTQESSQICRQPSSQLHTHM